MARFWFQSTLGMDKAPEYNAALARHCAAILDPGDQTDLIGVPPRTCSAIRSRSMRCSPGRSSATRSGRSKGYDAYIIGTYVEPFLREARCAVSIPVLSIFEATLLMACTLRHTVGIVTLNRDLAWIHKLNLEKHRLGARVGPILPIDPELPERALAKLLDEPGDHLESFRATARRAVELGADGIIPAEGLIAILAARHAVLEVDGAAVLDGIAVPVCFAQMAARLWTRAGLRTGRRAHYASASGEALAFVRAMVEPAAS